MSLVSKVAIVTGGGAGLGGAGLGGAGLGGAGLGGTRSGLIVVSAGATVAVVVTTTPSPQPMRKKEELTAAINAVAVSATGVGDMADA